jgi:HK97 family phage portal protein
VAVISGGQLMLADTSPTFARSTYWAPSGVALTTQFATYAAIWRAQLWVYVLVNKLALGTARLPIKVYERVDELTRKSAWDSPYAKLIRRPNPKHDPFFFWLWTASTRELYGEALWTKVRDGNGRPVELWPLHPVNVFTKEEGGELFYYFYGNASTEPTFAIPARDIVHFRGYNPDTTQRGVSACEPLRQTLLNEDSARRATTSFWARGARPGVTLEHPGVISKDASARLKANWEAVAAGTDRTGATVVLEEGMKANRLDLTAEEAQYLETRKLNREEVCAAFDVPPPVVHILDHATYSNITEQMRSLYRDTMAPRLGGYESTLDMQLRPDFGGDTLYAEFLLDEVLRGDFEQRSEAKMKAINSAQLTPNEARRMENLEPLDGGDRLFINSTMIPIDEVSVRAQPAGTAPAAAPPEGAPPVLPEPPQAAPPPKALTRRVAAKVAGRAVSCETLSEVDDKALVAGLNGAAPAVLALLDQSRAAGDDVSKFCALLWALAEG